MDTFSKYVSAVPLPLGRKITEHIAAARMETLSEMGCYDEEKGGKLPDTIYSNREGGLLSNKRQASLKTEKIRHLTTLGHAHVAERTVRTIRDLY